MTENCDCAERLEKLYQREGNIYSEYWRGVRAAARAIEKKESEMESDTT